MTPLHDDAIGRLRAISEEPDLSETRYELKEMLGRGGMGAVYAALDRELDRRVALKVIATAAATSGIAARLRKEAQILAQLEHPNIIPVHDVGVLPDGRSFYTMKLVQGRRLDEHINRGLPIADRPQIFERICDALAFAHAHGVIHRDLKPTNIMVGPFGEVLVLDWGVAKFGFELPERSRTNIGKAPDDDATGEGAIVGTYGFMSPEQERGDPDVDARSDIYALGSILHFLVAPPNDGAARVDAENPRRPRALAAIVERAMSPAAGSRYQSVVELAADLSRYREERPVQAYRESVLERAMRVLRRYRLPLALILAYVIMRLMLLAAFRP